MSAFTDAEVRIETRTDLRVLLDLMRGCEDSIDFVKVQMDGMIQGSVVFRMKHDRYEFEGSFDHYESEGSLYVILWSPKNGRAKELDFNEVLGLSSDTIANDIWDSNDA